VNESSSVLDTVIIKSNGPWSERQAKFYPNLWYLATKVLEVTFQNTLLFKLCFELQIVHSEVPNLAVQSLQEIPDCFTQKSVCICKKYTVFRTPIFV